MLPAIASIGAWKAPVATGVLECQYPLQSTLTHTMIPMLNPIAPAPASISIIMLC
jgi:hypothetical protein